MARLNLKSAVRKGHKFDAPADFPISLLLLPRLCPEPRNVLFEIAMIIRIFLAAVVLAALFYLVDMSDLVTVLRELDAYDISLLLLLSVILIYISSAKWKLFLQARGHSTSVLYLMKLYTVGYFVNAFSPSFVGGDVVRSLKVAKQVGNAEDALSATFFERFTGVLAMAIMSVAMLLLGVSFTKGIEISVILFGLGSGAIACVCFSSVVSTPVFKLLRWGLLRLPGVHRLGVTTSGVNRALDLCDRFERVVSFGRRDPVLISKAMLWSFAYHIFAVLNTYVAARAIGWDAPDIAGLFVVVPLVLIVSMIPLTPSGWGIQEGAFFYFLQRLGGSDAQSLGVGLVLRAKTLLLAMIGGLIWAAMKRSVPYSSSTTSMSESA